MLKKLIYLIICCFCVVPIEAQQDIQQKQQIIKLLQVIKDNIKFIDDNLPEPCRKRFEKSFQKVDTTNIRRKTLEELIRTSRQIIKTYKILVDTCNNDSIKKTTISTAELIVKLKALVPATEDSLKKKLVKLNIRVVNDSTNKAVNAKVNIVPIGSADTFRVSPQKLKDTEVFFIAYVLPSKTYLITVIDTFFSVFTDELSITKDSTIGIRLKRIHAALENDKKRPSKPNLHSRQTYSFRTFINDNPLLIICISVLFFLTLIGTILYIWSLAKGKVQLKKEYLQSGLNTISEPLKDLKTKDVTTSSNSTDLVISEPSPELIQTDQAESLIAQIKKADPDALSVDQRKVTDAATPSRSFNCEILMTAGPRKKFMSEPDADKDLGEDVCGFVSTTTDVLLWVLDGTSDLHCLRNPIDKREYFSSRLLAQLLAEKLKKDFAERSERGFDEIVLKAIQEVKEDLLIQINQLPDDEIRLLKNNIENKNFPECATTILVAKLSLNGDFTAYRSGDSKVFLFSVSSNKEISLVETFLATKNEKSDDRLFFRLQLNEEHNFNIFYNRPNNEIIKEKNINAIISFSDGIGMNTELFLKEEYRKSPVQVRKEIIYQMQGTGDDKSLCFIEIKESF